MTDQMTEPTWEERAADALSRLAETMPTGDDVVAGKPLPEWMGKPWLAALTDPADPKFTDSVIKAEAWLASH